MSFIDQLAELEKAKAKIAQAEAKLSADRVEALSKLPADYGYSDLNAFIKALKDAADKGAKGKRSKASNAVKVPKIAKAPKAGSGKRAKITDEVKAQVKVLAEEGKTGAEIASALGISQPSVQNIKKALGMVKARVASVSVADTVAEAAPEAAPAVEQAPIV